MAAFDSRTLRDALGSFVTGVTVITTRDADGAPHGLTVNSFSSVSLDPPLVLWSQASAAPSHAAFRAASHFAVNILAEDQLEVSTRFARRGDKFGASGWREGLAGLPLLEGCVAWLECRLLETHAGGDHRVFIGHVERLERTERRPLVFGGGRYLSVRPHHISPPLPLGAGVA